MLAQHFMTAEALGISNEELDALIKVLGMLERGELTHDRFHRGDVFNMGWWYGANECGTIGCICGWAYHVSGKTAFRTAIGPAPTPYEGPLNDLFVPIKGRDTSAVNEAMQRITPPQAAIALRNYLTLGEPRWAEALAT